MKDVALLNLDARTKRLLCDYIKSRPEGLYEWSMTPKRKTRTLQQNAFWHGVVVPHVKAGLLEAWGENLTKDETHAYLKAEFLSKPVVNKNTGEVRGNVPGSTAKLDIAEFCELIDKVTAWAADYLNTEIPPADKFYANEKSAA